MTKRTRFILIGGFLGAGKTTTITRLARHYITNGQRVGLVTNDQATDLVDTFALRSEGFAVGEVPGACFCCSFDSLMTTLESLQQSESPDVIIAEPVGSCTDVMATVLQPLRELHGDRYRLAPLTVLLKPEHGHRILSGRKKAGFSPKAAYIFMKQIEEADIVAVNKLDKLTEAEQVELIGMVRERFPEKHVLAISAIRGDGFAELTGLLDRDGVTPDAFMKVDYNFYAEGEAELGWLNSQISFTSRSELPFSIDRLVQQLLSSLATQLESINAETAHVKALGRHDQAVSIANLVARGEPVEMSRVAQVDVPQAQLILNARVATSPAKLESAVRRTIARIADAMQVDAHFDRMQCFRPGRPTPTHRLENLFG